ncbi:hypothetical protein CASFOL_020789 [Castilleja foliolosa]|uniref:Uncharacterized protein n=1 Tax=Castilleja foliolosa TaxID=1961234 RepID=A0ABD3D661_9LAMI
MSEKKSTTHSHSPTAQDCCDICGVAGPHPEHIYTCCQCKLNCEHIYCMRIFNKEFYEAMTEESFIDLVCEECESGSNKKLSDWEGKSFPCGVFRHLEQGTSSQPSDQVRDSKEAETRLVACDQSRPLLVYRRRRLKNQS